MLIAGRWVWFLFVAFSLLIYRQPIVAAAIAVAMVVLMANSPNDMGLLGNVSGTLIWWGICWVVGRHYANRVVA